MNNTLKLLAQALENAKQQVLTRAIELIKEDTLPRKVGYNKSIIFKKDEVYHDIKKDVPQIEIIPILNKEGKGVASIAVKRLLICTSDFMYSRNPEVNQTLSNITCYNCPNPYFSDEIKQRHFAPYSSEYNIQFFDVVLVEEWLRLYRLNKEANKLVKKGLPEIALEALVKNMPIQQIESAWNIACDKAREFPAYVEEFFKNELSSITMKK